jgi:hypothetical protein
MGQAVHAVLVPLDDITYPEGHAQDGPIETAPVIPQGMHSYDVVSKKDLPQVPFAINQYFACPLTAPKR